MKKKNNPIQWICIVILLLVLLIVFTYLRFPWWIVGSVLGLGILSWFETHETNQLERCYLFLLFLIITMYYYQMNKTRQENYVDGPNIQQPKKPNIEISDLTNQIQLLEKKLSNANPTPQQSDESNILSKFLASSTLSRPSPSMGDIQNVDLHGTIQKNEEEVVDPKKPIQQYSPAEAQRATFHLIDTVSQLKETMTSLSPVLKQGAEVMKLFQTMNLDEQIKNIDTIKLQKE